MNYAGCHWLGSMGFMNSGLLFFGLISFFIILAVIYLNNYTHEKYHKTTALELLNQEYAKGNVTEDDYKKHKKNLQDN